jgi:lysyl-tRNA synthetase class 1
MSDQPLFWSDQLAFATTKKFEDRDTYVCASGISPSGMVHIGNFREIITTDFVVKSLKERGEDTRFIYSWDDYDRFRKVPANVPDEWEQYIGLPLSKVPDPEECHDSYAEHFESMLEEQLEDMHMDIEFIRQTEMFEKAEYADLTKQAMNNREKIKEILDQYRKEPLEDPYYPLRVYCTECGKDFTEVKDYNGEYTVTYYCEKCGDTFELNFQEEGNVKPPWRVDWPMRWHYEQVSFEPGGKDHSAAGSSRDTGKEIIEEVYKDEAPVYQMYDFVKPKGSDKKISSSAGENTLTLDDLKQIYSPEMIRFLFSQNKPKSELVLAFDEEIIQVYDRFDRFEKTYFDEIQMENEKKEKHRERVYEIAVVDIPDEQPVRIPFKHASLLAQTIPEKDWETTALESLRSTDHIPKELSEKQKQQVFDRLGKAKNWARNYAPEDYLYSINEEPDQEVLNNLSEEELRAVEILYESLDGEFEDTDELDEAVFDSKDESELSTGEFFTAVYNVFLSRDQGPRLSTLIAALGVEKSRSIMEGYLLED